MKVFYLVWAVALCACRMGGPGGSALALVEPEDDAGVDAGDEGGVTGSSSGRGSSPGNQGSPSTPTDDAATGSSSEGGAATVADASTDSVSDAGVGSANSCSPTFDVCDPISNVGCLPLTQCIVDPSTEGMSGTCAFGNIPIDAGVVCEQNPLGTSCPPQHGCIDNECLRYCVCDSDCDPGSTCSIAVSASGRGLVKACTP